MNDHADYAIYPDDTTLLYALSGIWSVTITTVSFWTWICSMRHSTLGQEMSCWFQCWKNSACLFDPSKNSGATDMKIDGSLREEKSSFTILRLSFSSKLDWGSDIIFKTKTASMKIEAFINPMRFPSPELALYRSTILLCMEYYYHIWAGAPSCYLDMLDKLQKQISRAVGPSLAAFTFLSCEKTAWLETEG